MKLETSSEYSVLRQIFTNVDKYLAGTMDGEELFTSIYMFSKKQLSLNNTKKD